MKGWILLFLSFILALTAQTENENRELPDDIKKLSADEQAAYVIGLQIGENLRLRGIEPSIEQLMAGLKDALAGRQDLSDEDRQLILKAFRARLSKRKLEQEASYFQKLKNKQGLQELSDDLYYEELKPAISLMGARKQDYIRCRYKMHDVTGRLIEFSKKDAVFKVESAIAGWQMALLKMKVGARWRLYIPSRLAFGKKGFLPKIPPDTTVIIDVELLQVINQEAAEQREKAYFKQLSELKNIKSGSDGIYYQVLKGGTGAELKSATGVDCHYQFMLPDKTILTTSPAKGSKWVIDQQVKGLQTIIKQMRVGDKWLIHLPYKQAFGVEGQVPYIPPYATVIVELEIIKAYE